MIFCRIVFIVSFLFISISCLYSEGNVFDTLIPKPTSVVVKSDKYVLTKSLSIKTELLSLGTKSVKGSYKIICKDGRLIISGDAAGVFYAKQTLSQLEEVPAEFEIVDEPRFQWRGLHLDESRHFFGKIEVKRILDLMSYYKLNMFHWHLCDGPGWRIEIKSFPRLTSVGAWRIDKTKKPWNWRATEILTKPTADKTGLYGGFYTQDEIKEIVEYAKQRFITIIPEIELPGHSFAALMAYPELLACPTNNVPVDGLRGKDVLCAGNDSVFDFYQKVLVEVIALFPESPIHIGADEVPKDAWKQCPLCQKRMKDLQIKSFDKLQSYFVSRIARFLNDKKVMVFGWDEIMDGGLPSGAGVTIWRSSEFAVKSARDYNAPTVMSPQHPCYFNFRNVREKRGEPPAEDATNTLKDVYSFDPIPFEIKGTIAEKNILGVQANLWTEHIQTRKHLEYQLLPRLLALSEIAWNGKEARSYKGFLVALRKTHSDLLKKRGYSYCEKELLFSNENK